MVFNVTADDISVRMSAIDEAIWPPAPQKEKQAPDVSKMVPMSEFVVGGREVFTEIVEEIYNEINQRFGSNVPIPGGGN